MSPDAYAILILAPLFITGLLLAWFGGKVPAGQIGWRIIPILVGLLAGFIFFPVYSGAPILPLAAYIPALCVPVCALFVKKFPLAVVACALLTLEGFFASFLYESALDSPGTTDYSPIGATRRLSIDLEHLAADVYCSAAKPDAGYPSGYLDESKDENVRAIVEADLKARLYPLVDFKVTPFWHTNMTRLWHMQTRPARIWFDGGKLDNVNSYHIRPTGSFSDAGTFRVPRA